MGSFLRNRCCYQTGTVNGRMSEGSVGTCIEGEPSHTGRDAVRHSGSEPTASAPESCSKGRDWEKPSEEGGRRDIQEGDTQCRAKINGPTNPGTGLRD
jgi:hypothetical protein